MPFFDQTQLDIHYNPLPQLGSQIQLAKLLQSKALKSI